MYRICLFACLVALVAGAGLIDNPIAARRTEYLDGSDWVATSDEKLSVKASVPGDLLSDLHQGGLIGDPLHELNFQNSSIWDQQIWTYSRKFTVDNELLRRLAADNGTDLLLVFDGIKMGADIHLNGELLGHAADQFLRYVFPLKDAKLAPGENANEITVTFDPKMTVDGRFMACSGGWDWAPYSISHEGHNSSLAHTFSKGIWKSVYLAEVSEAAIVHMVPHTFYRGEHPTSPLEERKHAGFRLDVRLHLYSPRAADAEVVIAGVPGHQNSPLRRHLQLPAGESSATYSIDIDGEDVDLWWPVGLPGSQVMYPIKTAIITHGALRAEAIRNVGFRSIALVTGNDTDPEYVHENRDADGTDTAGMFIRVNGAAVYSRGANMIPMDQLEARYNAEAHEILVKSALDGGMNTLRVWGGGVFLPDVWYDKCDELGIIVYHDMQFAQLGHSPTKCALQDEEFRHQVRRLSHHPSIIIWDGCNECQVVLDTPTGIYASFVLTVVAEEDKSRILWPSCPGDGWVSGVNRLSSLPNDSPLGLRPRQLTTHKLETHGPYTHGTGFPAVNGLDDLVDFNANIPINLTQGPTGVHLPNVFASEFGCSVMSSFESMAPTLREEHWGLHGGGSPDSCTAGFDKVCTGNNVMAQRNYPCDNILDVYFGLKKEDVNATGEGVFKKQLWQCMVGQALVLKSDIETRRSTNEFGALIWQLGENWPTGGWGSIEYGSDARGQVLGGRWKPLHYWLRNSIFTDVTAACGRGGVCYVRNDMISAVSPHVTIRLVNFDGSTSEVFGAIVSLKAGPGAVEWLQIPEFDAANHVLEITVTEQTRGLLCHNVQLFDVPKRLNTRRATLSYEIADTPNSDGSIDIVVHSDQVALFVTLTTLEHGRFSDNAMLVVPPSRHIKFIPFRRNANMALLRSTLRLEDTSAYM